MEIDRRSQKPLALDWGRCLLLFHYLKLNLYFDQNLKYCVFKVKPCTHMSSDDSTCMKRDIAVDDKKWVNEEICLNMQMITAIEIECNGIVACHFHKHTSIFTTICVFACYSLNFIYNGWTIIVLKREKLLLPLWVKSLALPDKWSFLIKIQNISIM